MEKRKSRRERFEDVAQRRTNNALNSIRLIANCANKHNYEYSRDDIQKIINALKREVSDLQSAFNANQTKGDFKL
jgi:hypothetical protein